MEVISFLNNKGGVGKTTLCSNIAQALAITGKKVLCIDNDSQHSLCNRLQIDVGKVNIKHLYRDFSDTTDYMPFLQKAVFETSIPYLHCITSTFNLLNSDVKSLNILKNFIYESEIAEYYDFVLIDNHPGLDMLQQVSILASNRFFIPVFLKQQSLEGLTEIVLFLHSLLIKDEAITIIPNHYEGLKNDKNLISVLREMFPKNTTDTYIPKDRIIEDVEQKNKILFLDRLLSSKAVPFLIKLLTELFPEHYKENDPGKVISQKRTTYRLQKNSKNLNKIRRKDGK